MGLTIRIKGMPETYDCGYITFSNFRKGLAYTYDFQLGGLYEKDMERGLTESEAVLWNRICNNDLDIFLFHSDCDGKLTPQECRKIYNVIKDLKMDMVGHNYGDMKTYNMLERWKEMFKFCYQHRLNMYFT